MTMTDSVKAAEGIIREKVFLYPVRVYYEDTDAGGIVYYANYLKFAERARSEFLRHLGINQQRDLQENHCGFVVRSCNIEYLSSAFLNDDLVVSCSVRDLGAASTTLHQEVRRGNDLLSVMDVKGVYLNADTHRPTRFPPEYYNKFKELCL